MTDPLKLVIALLNECDTSGSFAKYSKISNPSANAYLGDTQATGTILNDD